MSGFAGLFHLQGGDIDRRWLDTMAAYLAPCGPDGQEVWVQGSAGLCHALLRTSARSDGSIQIANLDGDVWIAADARIDDREALIARLPGDPASLARASSAELILRAYAAWGEKCLEHLLGDFAFVIWETRHKRVFGARDRFGARPFYYAVREPYLIVSNVVDCIRQVPIVPATLDDYAIGDFLLLGVNRQAEKTYYRAIARLPVAHSLIAGANELRTKRYWTFPVEEPVYYSRAEEYSERFLELTRAAVRDRLPDGPLGILMSGGLDSPTVAAISVELGARVSAFTTGYERLIADDEKRYAQLVADYLKIPFHYQALDEQTWGWRPGSAPMHTPEPYDNPLPLAADFEYDRYLAKHAKVFFIGDGPDLSLLYEWQAYLKWLVREKKWTRLCRDVALHFRMHRRVPLLRNLPRLMTERYFGDSYQDIYPSWINPEFERRVGLRDRWETIGKDPLLPHPVHPLAYSAIAGDFPMGSAGSFDSATGETPVVRLHPLCDLRVVRFLLTAPVIPWCRTKALIRCALRGKIPEEVRTRAKTPLTGFPYIQRIREMGAYPELTRVPALGQFVKDDAFPCRPAARQDEIDRELKILGLNYWLASLDSVSRTASA